jgi:epimerase transport system membrane fusion protein
MNQNEPIKNENSEKPKKNVKLKNSEKLKNIENHEQSVEEHHAELEKAHHSTHRTGTITILLIFGLFGIWSVFADIETTITANGKVITQTYNKSVMHPRGGIVKEIFVHEGDLVKKDQPLLMIDNTEESSKLASNVKKYDRNLFLTCKLKTQSTLEAEMDCSEYARNIIEGDELERLQTDTQALFASDMRSLKAKIDLLKNKNNILLSQNNGLKNQIDSNKRLLASFQRELKKWEKLLKSDAVDELKIIDTQRRIEESHLQIGSLQSRIEENLATVKANDQQMVLEKETFKNTALTKLIDTELESKLIHDAIDSLKNTIENATIKSPDDGLVTDMKIHASREVVLSQKEIMSIVPNNKNLIIEAYVLPSDIEKVYTGQKAEISFPAFVDPSAIPIGGELTYISADTITAEGEKESYYVVLLKITPEGFKAIKRNGFKIIPGMPSAVFIKTGKKTLMEYLTQPIIQMFKGIYHAN